MSRFLSLLRHAKSDWNRAGLDDRERPLNGRGRAAAPRMGRLMADKAMIPDLILCSSAVRARQTLSLAAEAMGAKIDAETGAVAGSRLFDTLYLAGPDRMLDLLRAEGGEASHVLMLGHNPGMQNLAIRLAEASGGRGAGERLRRKFPTAALAMFEMRSANWDDFQENDCRLVLFTIPKSLPGED